MAADRPEGPAPTMMRSRTDMVTIVDCRSEEHTSELQSRLHLVCRLLLEKKKNIIFALLAIGGTRTMHGFNLCARDPFLVLRPIDVLSCLVLALVTCALLLHRTVDQARTV